MEETVVNRPLGKIGGPLFCICLFITSLYGAVFLVGPALSLIYIWVRVVRSDQILTQFSHGSTDELLTVSSLRGSFFRLPCFKKFSASNSMLPATASTTWKGPLLLWTTERESIGCSFGLYSFTAPDYENSKFYWSPIWSTFQALAGKFCNQGSF